MNLRKFFNLPNKHQKNLINVGFEQLDNLAESKKVKHNKNENQYESDHNGICPLCRNKKIVNKISRVQGSGEVSGYMSFGSGSIYGSSSIDTSEVNHCNDCGNEWKKYKYNWYSKDDILREIMSHLDYALKGEYHFYDEILDELEDIPAESIYRHHYIIIVIILIV